MSEMNIHSNSFELCRICLREPEEDRNVNFIRIFSVDDPEDCSLQLKIEEIFAIKIERDCDKPKIICQNCLDALTGFMEMKKKAADSDVIINYLKKKNSAHSTASVASPSSSLNSNNEGDTRLRPKTNLLPVTKTITRNVINCEIGNSHNIPSPSTYKLFTCTKPTCKLIFQSFDAFKLHFQRHFKYENKSICWLCCVPFSNISNLKRHQINVNCCVLGAFRCYQCSELFKDLESISIHKFTFHDGDLVPCKNSVNTINCVLCQNQIYISEFKNHLKKDH